MIAIRWEYTPFHLFFAWRQWFTKTTAFCYCCSIARRRSWLKCHQSNFKIKFAAQCNSHVWEASAILLCMSVTGKRFWGEDDKKMFLLECLTPTASLMFNILKSVTARLRMTVQFIQSYCYCRELLNLHFTANSQMRTGRMFPLFSWDSTVACKLSEVPFSGRSRLEPWFLSNFHAGSYRISTGPFSDAMVLCLFLTPLITD